MKKHRELETPSYWPGYVDALTNVVLNLLFMVGIFAIGIFALRMEAALRPKKRFPESAVAMLRQGAAASGPSSMTSERPQAARNGAIASAIHAPERSAYDHVRDGSRADKPVADAAGHGSDGGSAPQPLVLRVAGVGSERQAPVEWRGEHLRFVSMAGRPLTRVLFAKSDFSISDENRALIADSLRKRAQGAHLKIWTTVDDRDAQDRREGYLRVMSVRSSLIGLGIAAQDIDARIFVGAARGASDSRRVTLLVD